MRRWSGESVVVVRLPSENARVGVDCRWLGVTPRAQLLKKSAWWLHLIGDAAPPTFCDNVDAARVLSRRSVTPTPERMGSVG